jgi:hypothetical protein
MSLLDLAFAGAHLTQGAIITGLIANSSTPSLHTITRTSKFGGAGNYTYDIKTLLPVFPLLSAVNHLANYVSDNTMGPELQWAEYGFSASVMLWVISSLCGIEDISTLVTIVIQNMVMQYIGYRLTQAKTRSEYLRYLKLGFIIHATIWIPIVTTFYTSLEKSPRKRDIPSIVFYIVWMMFALFSVFGLYAVAVPINEPGGRYGDPNRGYPYLSLLTKSLLTWMVYFGVMRPEQDSAIQKEVK